MNQSPFFKTKIIYVALGGLLLVAIPLVLFFVTNTPQQNNGTTPIVTPSAFPSSVIPRLSLLSVTPQNGTTTLNYYQPIQITFSQTPTDAEKSQIQIQSSPTVAWIQTWNDAVLTVTPSTALEPGQQYRVTIFSNQNSLTISFSTLSQEAATQKQGEADKNFSQHITNTLNSYPWYQSLPLQTDAYFVYFDTNRKTIVARIYNGPSLSQDQISRIKNEVTTKLVSIGVDLNTFPVDWQLIQ